MDRILGDVREHQTQGLQLERPESGWGAGGEALERAVRNGCCEYTDVEGAMAHAMTALGTAGWFGDPQSPGHDNLVHQLKGVVESMCVECFTVLNAGVALKAVLLDALNRDPATSDARLLDLARSLVRWRAVDGAEVLTDVYVGDGSEVEGEEREPVEPFVYLTDWVAEVRAQHEGRGAT